MNICLKKKRHKPLYEIDAQNILTYHLGGLYVLDTESDVIVKIGDFPLPVMTKLFVKFRLLERLLRLEVRASVALNKNIILVSYRGKIYSVNLAARTIKEEHTYRQEMNNPLSFNKIENINGFQDCVVYGEYFSNPRRKEVTIYRRLLDEESEWEKIYEFPHKTIRHIHAIIPDKYRNQVFILTGDDDTESGVWITKNNFKSLEPILIGSQQYRSCCAFPIEEGLLFATDTPSEQNYIGIMKQDSSDFWGAKRLFNINGTVMYATKCEDNYIFNTAVEAGIGVRTEYSELILVNSRKEFKLINKFKKDIFPMKLFQYGCVQFCNSRSKNTLYLYPIAVKKMDSVLLKVEL